MEFDIVIAASAFGAAPMGSTWLRLLVIAPVLEEVIFRRGLHEALLRMHANARLHGTAFTNLSTATLFSLCHFALHPGATSVLVVIPALGIGWVYQRTRCLAPCVAIHAAFNAVWLMS